MFKKIFSNKSKTRNDGRLNETILENRIQNENREERQILPIIPVVPVIPKTDLQKWLDDNYPKNHRVNIRELDISNQWQGSKTIGDLKFEGFVNLEKLNCSNNDLTSLDLNDCLELWHLNCENNKIKKLDLNNCFNLQHLLCSNNQLTRLNLNNYHKLEKLEFNNNRLSTLDISNLSNLNNLSFINNQLANVNVDNCPNITEINFSNNSLVSVENLLENLNSGKLEVLNISNNNFSRQDLSCFSRFVNLRNLFIGDNNRFYGSLEPLQNLGNLGVLKIDNTNINLGLEYLPNSIKEFSCASGLGNKVKSLQKELTSFIVERDKNQIEFKVNVLVEEERRKNEELRRRNKEHADYWNKERDYQRRNDYRKTENLYYKRCGEDHCKILRASFFSQEKFQVEATTSFFEQDIQGWKNTNSNKFIRLKKKENVSPFAFNVNENLSIPNEIKVEDLTKDQMIQYLKEKNRQLQKELEEVKGLNEEKIKEKEKRIMRLEKEMEEMKVEARQEIPPKT